MNFPLPQRVVGHVAFDFDGTLATGTWPSPTLGEPIELGVTALRFYFDRGWGIYIWTARPASHAPRIWEWLERNGLREYVYDIKTDKPLTDVLIDDRAMKFPEGLLNGS